MRTTWQAFRVDQTTHRRRWIRRVFPRPAAAAAPPTASKKGLEDCPALADRSAHRIRRSRLGSPAQVGDHIRFFAARETAFPGLIAFQIEADLDSGPGIDVLEVQGRLTAPLVANLDRRALRLAVDSEARRDLRQSRLFLGS